MNSTVKRKFNALLQGISNGDTPNRPASDSATAVEDQPSTTRSTGLLPQQPARAPSSVPNPPAQTPSIFSSPASTIRMGTSDLEYLGKKRRVAGPPSTPSKYGDVAASSPSRGPHTTTTISNVTLRKWTPSGSPAPPSSSGATSELKYCPGDRDQLLRRLATFQELTDWTPKPERVSEVEWAKRGWTCHGKERVQCALCGRALAVGVNRKEVDGKEISVLIASEVAEGVVNKYAELIVDGHGQDCLWRRKGCDDSLLRLPLSHPRLALSALRQRYDDLVSRSAFLPYDFNLRLPPTLDLDAVLSYLPATFFSDPPPTTTAKPPNRPALALALLGWQGLTNPRLGEVPNSASCHTCLRRLGLWMFKSREVDADTNEILVPAPMDHLDPLREHRFFCPWKNGAAQRNPGAAAKEEPAGWEVLVQVLRNESLVRMRVGTTAGVGEGGTPVGHGRSKSSVPAVGRERPGTGSGSVAAAVEGGGGGEKDKDVMSRLRRVKSLFNAKAGGRLRRLSRPGTAGSTGGGE